MTLPLRKTALPLALALLAMLAVCAQVQVDRVKPVRKDELVYLPNEKLLTHFTAGLSSVIADFLWLRCVQYTGAEIKGDHDYAWLSQLLNTVVRMDPYFKDAYRFGGMFLAALKADDSAGLDLLQRGMVERPDAWDLPYEAGMIYLLNRRDAPESQRMAAYYLGMSAATGKSPHIVAETASALQGKYNLDDIESEMWTSLKQSGDKVLRALAERKEKELQIRQNLRVLDDNAKRFMDEKGYPPLSLEELIATGYFGEQAKAKPEMLMNDILGGHYFIGPGGKALNTSLLDSKRDQDLGNLRDAVKQYKEDKGTFPPTLDALVDKYAAQISPHPYPKKAWTYNPLTGEVGD